MGAKKFLNDGFRDLAALTLGEDAQSRTFGEALASSLSKQKPEVISDIIDALAQRFPNSFASVVTKRLSPRAASSRAQRKSSTSPAP
jgi:hypothetical protein